MRKYSDLSLNFGKRVAIGRVLQTPNSPGSFKDRFFSSTRRYMKPMGTRMAKKLGHQTANKEEDIRGERKCKSLTTTKLPKWGSQLGNFQQQRSLPRIQSPKGNGDQPHPRKKKEKIKSLESFSHRSNLWFLPSFSFTNKTHTTPFFKNAKNRERAKQA